MLDLLERAGRRGHQSLAAALIADGETVSERWCDDGPRPDAGTLFEIGSITKPFTAVLLADNPARARHAQERPAQHAAPTRSPGASVRARRVGA